MESEAQSHTPVIPAEAGIQKTALQQVRIQVSPIGIRFLNQPDFPGPVPFLELFLSGYGAVYIVNCLVVDEVVDTVFLGESINQIALMLMPPFD